jgi:cation-transporting ATPase 13A1
MLTTEPFRIPLAGVCDTCLFDKTGTLTTEHLTLRGLVWSSGNNSTTSSGWSLVPPQRAPPSAQQILAACHSLVEVSRV